MDQLIDPHNNMHLSFWQSNIWGVDESSKELGARDRGQPLREHMGVYCGAYMWGGVGRMGLQPHQVHQQALARNHQEWFFLEKHKESLTVELNLRMAPILFYHVHGS